MQTANQLVDNCSERTGVRNLALDALGNDLVVRRDIGLEVAILRVRLASARTHRAQRAHATVALVLLAIREDDLAGRFLAASKKRTQHDGVRAGNNCLTDITGVLQAAISNQRHTCRLARKRCQIDRSHLRYTHARNNTRCTN